MMRVPVYIVCAALVVVVNSEDNYYGGHDGQVGVSSDEQETPLGYLLPRLMAKYNTNRQWNGANYAPYLPDIDTNDIDNQVLFNQEGRSKRAGYIDRPSLSISNSLDVLRNRLLLEISRKKAMQGVNRNRDLLCKIGKRAQFDTKRKCDESEKFVEDI